MTDRNKLKTYVTTMRTIIQATDAYLASGVAFVPKNTDLPAIVNQGGLLSYLREIAKERDMPFIQAYDTFRVRGREREPVVILRIPNIIKLSKITGQLAIVAHRVYDRNNFNQSEKPVTVIYTISRKEYKFQGTGIKVFFGWYDQCRTDPIYRIVLGI